jgi:cell division septation protein DedD
MVAVWLIWQALSGWPAFAPDDDLLPATQTPVPTADGSRVEQPPEPVTPAEGEGRLDDAPDPGASSSTREAADLVPPDGAGVELTYSVLVGSYVTWNDAVERRDELTEDGTLAFVAPTVIAGRGRLYYRVFAGAFEDREQARELMRRLVESGGKERERDWDMRPVRLAFAMAEFASSEEAAAAAERLHEAGVPAYVLPGGTEAEARFHVYSGAFESAEAAAALDSILAATGSTAVLETRRGRTR